MPESPLWLRPVSYAAVGATKADDLMERPPAGFRPFRQRSRIGHGDDRWKHAWTSVLSWGIQRNSGMSVEVADAPAAITDHTYVPVSFDADGTPIAGETGANTDETVFGPDGMPFVTPGITAILRIPFGPLRIAAPARVVYVIDEENRRGFAYGTLRGHPESGEESFIVERTDDGSVWLEIRALSRPGGFGWWLVYPVLRLVQSYYLRRYFESLSGPLPAAQS
jgi:uncharacterized protein (UPF0548 family)